MVHDTATGYLRRCPSYEHSEGPWARALHLALTIFNDLAHDIQHGNMSEMAKAFLGIEHGGTCNEGTTWEDRDCGGNTPSFEVELLDDSTG